MSKVNQIKRDIEQDINLIKETLQKEIYDKMIEIHKLMDGKYQARINKWGLSQYEWSDKFGFNYDYMNKEEVQENLKNMIGKLEGYKQDLDLIVNERINSNNPNNIKIYNSNNNNNSNINIVDFNNVALKIKNNESLTEEQTKEALEIFEELKTIYKSKDNKKAKWNKVKKILIWLADKSVDLGISFLPTISSMFMD